MKCLRICLLLIMILLIFLMFSLPGLQDSRQMAIARHHYYDSPSDATRKEIDAAWTADRKQMIKIEFVLGTFLVASAILFFRLGKRRIAN